MTRGIQHQDFLVPNLIVSPSFSSISGARGSPSTSLTPTATGALTAPVISAKPSRWS